MTWSYSGDPSNSNGDAVRFLSGQTSTADTFLVSDEEISYLIAQTPSNEYAAAKACESLANRYAIGAAEGEGVGPFRAEWGDRAKKLREQAKTLRAQAVLHVSPFVGGARVSDRDSRLEDTDRVLETFTVGMDDQPTTILTDTNST